MVEGLLETSSVTDFYADGIHHIEIMGPMMRMVYYKWRAGFSGVLEKVAVEYAVVKPLASLYADFQTTKDDFRNWKVPIIKATSEIPALGGLVH